MKELKPEERLIVAADFKPSAEEVKNERKLITPKKARVWVKEQVLSLADKLHGTGVYLKVNSALRACGYDLIDEIHDRGLRVFADLKLFDIGHTLGFDGFFLNESSPEIVTVVCSTGVEAMQALKAELPETEVVGVTVLTTFAESDSDALFTCSTEQAVLRCAHWGSRAGIGGLVSSAKELDPLRQKFETMFSFNTPAIRPLWSVVEGDDQNPDRIMTPAKAIEAGATRIVIGRPIIRSENPREAVLRTIEEIRSVCN
ncbi:orotidine-5'-phosphate decarboxylase [Candidatus Nomurabacteria bacterium]|nr:orotidine-5'-phosphate decarboxylase [Candidatus Nomurabacteria bacterium]